MVENTAPLPATGSPAWSAISRHRLIIAGALFAAAGNAIAYADAGYALASPVFALILLGSFLVPFLVALPFSRWRLANALVFAIGATHFVDVTFLADDAIAALVVTLLPVAIVAAVLKGHADLLLRFAGTAVAFATLSILGQQYFAPTLLTPQPFTFAESSDGKGRPYLHVILDEMGPLSVMPSSPEYAELEARMRSDYARRGFAVFDDTQVIAGATHVSLGNVLATGHDANYEMLEDGAFAYGLGGNRLIATLQAAHYSVSVLQSSYIDLCRTENPACRTYARSGDGAAIEAAGKTFAARLGYAMLDLHLLLMQADATRASSYYRTFVYLAIAAGADIPQTRLYLARPPQVLEQMRDATATLSGLGRGEAFVAHLLLPHFPYVLGADCALKDVDERAAPRWLAKPGDGVFVRDDVERAYWEQAACTHDALMAMIDAVIESPEGKDAMIVVHGDHGSRILEKIEDPAVEDANAEERRHALTTHFAVRGIGSRIADFNRSQMLRDRVGIAISEISGEPAPDGVATSALR